MSRKSDLQTEKAAFLKILIFSWRDIKNPLAGGSEIFVHEVAKRWTGIGHLVTVFASKYKGCMESEDVDGVRVIRRGNRLTVYFLAWMYYLKCFRAKFNVVVEVKDGGLPWFSKLYAEEPVMALVHQTGRSFDEFDPKNSTWFYEAPLPVSFLAYITEPFLLKFYENMTILAVSDSTKKDLLDLGLDEKNIFIVPEGVNVPLRDESLKEKTPTLIYVGRLKKSKRVHDIIKALAIVKEKFPSVKLWIVGQGSNSYFHELRRLVKSLDLESNVIFYGYVSDRKKISLMQRAYAIVLASVREGWGLVVTEANAYGTPAIAYDVPGLRDSIKNGETGLLAKSGSVEDLAEKVVTVLSSDSIRAELSRNALGFSKGFSWNNSAEEFMKVLEQTLDER